MQLHHSTSNKSRRSNASDLSDQPTQTFHPSFVPKPSGILGSAASGAHYSGAKVHHRRADVQRASGSRDPSDIDEAHAQVINDLKELYSGRPTPEILHRRWRDDAVVEDSLLIGRGMHEVAALWYAMPKFCTKLEVVAIRVLSSNHSPNRIIYSQTLQYTLRVLGSKKTAKSIILVELDDEDRIVRLEDQRNGEELPSAWGSGLLRRLNGKLAPWLVRLPKDLRNSK